MDYIRLKDIQDFTVTQDNGFSFKMWDEQQNQMLTSKTYQEGYQKRYSMTTDKGELELSQAQLGQMLSSAYKNGSSNIVGKKFNVKNNGQEGKEIRYFINLDYKAEQSNPGIDATPQAVPIDNTPPISQDDIPF